MSMDYKPDQYFEAVQKKVNMLYRGPTTAKDRATAQTAEGEARRGLGSMNASNMKSKLRKVNSTMAESAPSPYASEDTSTDFATNFITKMRDSLVPDKSTFSKDQDLQSLTEKLKQEGLSGDYISAIKQVVNNESGSDWTIKENHNYSPAKAVNMFSALKGMSTSDVAALRDRGADAFFEKVYGAESATGKALGNIDSGDGAKYAGRSYIQLTGRSNYEKYAGITGHAIDENPDLLTTNHQVAMDVTAAYLKDRLTNTGNPLKDVNKAVTGSFLRRPT